MYPGNLGLLRGRGQAFRAGCRIVTEASRGGPDGVAWHASPIRQDVHASALVLIRFILRVEARRDVPTGPPRPTDHVGVVMARSRASIKDVAARAGVSLGTVSNVLNQPEMVSDPTRERVHAAIAELGFVRNEPARQLRAGRSRTIA